MITEAWTMDLAINRRLSFASKHKGCDRDTRELTSELPKHHRGVGAAETE